MPGSGLRRRCAPRNDRRGAKQKAPKEKALKHVFGATLAALCLVSTVPARADLGAVIARYGNWEVRRAGDLMTGKTYCGATYKARPDIQLYRDALYIKASSWRNPRAYRYRIDDQPVSPMVTAPAVVWRTRTVAFQGAEFNRLLQAHRLRLQVMMLHTLSEFDLDLTGIYSAYGAIYYCH
jgi:hypothetical protein